MTKIWADEVNDSDTVEHLQKSFKCAIQDHHNDIYQHIRDKSVRKDSATLKAVMKKFFSALVDTSINEKSVHYLNSTDLEFDSFYNIFEDLLIKEVATFIKRALEVGYKAKNLKLVYGVFEEYSSTIKSFLPIKTQKMFEKHKTEIVVKFIRFILWSRVKQFSQFDASRINATWNSSFQSELQHVFGFESSVFVKHLLKVVEEKKYDKLEFQKYWIIMTGKDASLLQKFYDTTILYYNKFLKAVATKDKKIRLHKETTGIELPTTTDEMTLLSLTRHICDSFVEEISDTYIESIKSKKNWRVKPIECETLMPSSFFYKEDCKLEESSEAGEDKETVDCSESSNKEMSNGFSDVYKTNSQCWDVQTKSMKKSKIEKRLSSNSNERRASM